MSDWGQGAKNNDIGWGQGAVNNDISWGAVHADSWAGDTDIVGLDPAQAIINAFKTRVSADGGTFEAEQCLKDSLPALIENEPSLLVTPNAGEAGKLFSIIPTNGAGDLDVVRATTATYVDADGLIKTALANVPRLDYTNGSCPSILVEPQRTNLVFPSDTATTQTRTVTAAAHTLSFYGTGSVTLSGVATGTLNGTGVNNRVTLTFTPTAGSLILTVIGSVTNWQLEAGSNATSLIQTVSTSVTRNADVISKSGISSLIGQTEGSVYFEIDFNVISNAGIRAFFSLEGDISNQFSAFNVSTALNGNDIYYAGTSYNLTQGVHKIVCSYNQTTNTTKLYVDGVLRATSTTFSGFASTITRVSLGSRINPFTGFVTDRYQNGSFNSFMLFPTELTDAQCIQLTTL